MKPYYFRYLLLLNVLYGCAKEETESPLPPPNPIDQYTGSYIGMWTDTSQVGGYCNYDFDSVPEVYGSRPDTIIVSKISEDSIGIGGAVYLFDSLNYYVYYPPFSISVIDIDSNSLKIFHGFADYNPTISDPSCGYLRKYLHWFLGNKQ